MALTYVNCHDKNTNLDGNTGICETRTRPVTIRTGQRWGMTVPHIHIMGATHQATRGASSRATGLILNAKSHNNK